MGRQIVAQVARRSRFAGLLPQVREFANQQVDLRLLANNDFVELVQRVFSKAGLDFQLGDALLGTFCGVHGGIGHHVCRDGFQESLELAVISNDFINDAPEYLNNEIWIEATALR